MRPTLSTIRTNRIPCGYARNVNPPARFTRSASRSVLVRSEYVPGELTSPAITTVRWNSNPDCFRISALSYGCSVTSGVPLVGKGSPGGPK